MHDQFPHDKPHDPSPHDDPPEAPPISPSSPPPHCVSRTTIPPPPFLASSSPPLPPPPAPSASPSAPPPRRGRPSILADETKQAEILAIVAAGASMFAAANYVGVHVQTLRRLIRTDKRFRQRLEQAEGRHEIDMVNRLDRASASRKYWRAAAWKLERVRPSVYRPHRRDVITKPGLALMVTNWCEAILDVIPGRRLRQRVVEAMNKVIAGCIAPDPRRDYAAKKPLSLESWDQLQK